MNLRTCVAVFLVALTLPVLPAAIAQSQYPQRPIKLVVPFGPGASTDNVARLAAQSFSEQLGTQVLVDNKPGAASTLGISYVAKSPNDGYTLLFNTSSLVTNYVYSPKSTSYHPITDFSPVGLIAILPYVYVVSSVLPVSNVNEFIAYAKKHPGKIAYGSPGTGSATHLGMELFLSATGITALHVPYKGSAPALLDTVAGRVQFFTGSVSTLLPFLNDSRLKLLVLAAPKRFPGLKDVPTVDETVARNFWAGIWQGILAPARTSPAIVTKLNGVTQRFLKDPNTIARLEVEGGLPLESTPEEYSDYIKKEIDTWSKVIRDANIQPE